MFERLMLLGSLALGVCLLGSGCSSASPEKSTGTNWLECESDADCASVAGARCGEDGVCVDRDGNKIVNAVRAQDAGPTLSNMTDAASTPSNMTDAAVSTTLIVVDCYSPGQNLDRAYDLGSVGCECPSNAEDTCINGVALTCIEGHWQAVEDGACGTCWTPSEPDLAQNDPSNGCRCATEEMDACAYSQFTGYLHAYCTGAWQLSTNTSPCATCDSDLQCPVDMRCEAGSCQSAGTPCSVNGVLYPDGTEGIPDPLSCNTCMCANGGYLGCTTEACLEPEECPSGTTPAAVCGGCGPLDVCTHVITGCLPVCQTNADCEQGMTCMATQWPESPESARACTYVCP